MSDVAQIIADMVRAGVDPDLVGRAAAAFAQNVQNVQIVQDPVADRRRAYDRERKAAAKASRSTGIPPESEESADLDLSPKERPPTPPKEITPIPVSEARASSTDRTREFAEFWSLFPNKVGKRDAEKAFASARSRAPFAAIMTGVRRYLTKTDDRAWCNPATFLNQDRWEDQPATAPQQRGGAPPKPQSLGDMFREDARQKGILHDQPPHNPPGRMETRDGDREVSGAGDARVIALTRNVLGGFR